MAKNKDSEGERPQATPSSIETATEKIDRKTSVNKDPDLYDPVGMAGKKAGIVEEIEQQVKEEAHDPRTEPQEHLRGKASKGTPLSGPVQDNS